MAVTHTGTGEAGSPVFNYLTYLATMALVLATPFEAVRPLLAWQGMDFTLLEILVLGVLAVWVGSLLLAGRLPRLDTPLTAPVLFLLATMILATRFAPGHQQEALHFTARFATGILIFFLILNTVASRQRLRWLLIGITIAATIVAGLGILEALEVPPVIDFLDAFKHVRSRVGGQVRISSTFVYATITSMYLEMAFGVMIGLLLPAIARGRLWATLAMGIAIAMTAQAIILTFSRAGLLSMASVLVVVGGLHLLRCGFDRGTLAVGGVGLLVMVLLGHTLLGNSTVWLRLTTESDKHWYQAEYRGPACLNGPACLKMTAGEVRWVDVELTNTGRITWQPAGENPFHLSYHWRDRETDEMVIRDGERTSLPRAVPPGDTVTVRARIQAPPMAGAYILVWDMVQEGKLWFSMKGAPTQDIPVMVEGNVSPTVSRPFETRIEVDRTPDRLTLWRVAGRMLRDHPLLGVGPDNFRLVYGYRDYADVEDWDRGIHSNNMYIEMFADVGIVGGLAFLWLIWRLVRSQWQVWRAVDEALLPYWLGVVGALTAFLLHGLVDYFFEFTSTYLAIWTTVGLALAIWAFLRPSGDPYENCF